MSRLKEKNIFDKTLLWVMLGLATFARVSISHAQKLECQNALEEAVEMFDVENDSGVIDLWTRCSLASLTEPQQQARAYRILAASVNKVFHNTDYRRVVVILKKYLPADFAVADTTKIHLYEVLGESYIKQNSTREAKDTIENLVHFVREKKPNYQPDQTLSQTFRDYYRDAKNKLIAQNEKSSKKWYWIGGAGAVAIGITAAALLTGGGPEQLPPPPGPPKGN